MRQSVKFYPFPVAFFLTLSIYLCFLMFNPSISSSQRVFQFLFSPPLSFHRNIDLYICFSSSFLSRVVTGCKSDRKRTDRRASRRRAAPQNFQLLQQVRRARIHRYCLQINVLIFNVPREILLEILALYRCTNILYLYIFRSCFLFSCTQSQMGRFLFRYVRCLRYISPQHFFKGTKRCKTFQESFITTTRSNQLKLA